MTRILFICHGNICRSPMAEFVMKNLVKKAGLESQFHIESAATSTEEIGNPVYPPARRKLVEHGIGSDGHAARQLRNEDYDRFDLLVGMDKANLRNMHRICGGDFDGKIHLLMEYAGRPDAEVADPWYTDDFEATWQDVLAGCQGLLDALRSKMSRKIVCFGDSNTYGYDPRSYLGGRYPESVRWTGLLKAAGWEVWNEGENGRSIPRLDGEIQAVAQVACRIEAQVMTVMLGSNDLLQRPGLRAEVAEDRMERFLTTLFTDIPPSLNILLIAPPPMSPGVWVSDERLIEESRKLAGCYKILAQKLGIHFADAGAWGVDITFDGVHFSELGHRAFAEELQKTLEQIIPLK